MDKKALCEIEKKMILQPCNVELTKVHYYDQNKRSQNMSVSTISREMYQNSFNKNMLIKKNIFGHRWVLKINEQGSSDPKKKPRRRCVLFAYILVFISIVLAVCFGIIFSLDHNIFRAENKNTPNGNINVLYENNKTGAGNMFVVDSKNIIRNKSLQLIIIPKSLNRTINGNKSTSDNIKSRISKVLANITRPYCNNCTKDQVCIKTKETEKPRCIQMIDKRDPTGCGGLCKINTEYCKNLDKSFHVYQCLRLNNLLKCPEKTFNCGNMCISLEKRCDGQIDCANMIDEKGCECSLDTHFQCGNRTSCLEKSKFCNGKVDCWDKSDEIYCQKDVPCEQNYIPCLNGQCIPKEKMCDKVFDCLDKTDEPLWCQQIRQK